MVQELLHFLYIHKLISSHQHGFLQSRSASTNLLESLNDWTISLSYHRSVVVAYIDFARAFDSISYPKLFIKLEGYGIRGNLMFLLKAFLTNRTQSVRVASSMSLTYSVTSGVPQGSVLGPLLFNLFINDVTDGFSRVSAKLYADDIKLYSELYSPDSALNFQNHLDLISAWSSKWQISISHSKCSILELGRDNLGSCFSLDNQIITRSGLVKDLGVHVDSDLSFAPHIRDIVSRAKQRSSLIFRCFLSHNIINLKRAFITYIRPLVEFASQVWSPSLVGLINEIESVQRSFTKRLPGFYNFSYSERLGKLNLQTLEHRRLIADLIVCFNTVKGYTVLNCDSFFKLCINSSLRVHHLRFNIPLEKLNVRRFFWSYRVINVWNSLPSSIVSLNTTAQFKKCIIKHDLSKFFLVHD